MFSQPLLVVVRIYSLESRAPTLPPPPHPPPQPPLSPFTGHQVVRLHLEMWARLFLPTFAEQYWKPCRLNVLPQLSVLDRIKHATCEAKFIQFMCLDLLRILQQTRATSNRVSVRRVTYLYKLFCWHAEEE